MHLVAGACDIRFCPPARPLVLLGEVGHPQPVLERELHAVMDPRTTLLARVGSPEPAAPASEHLFPSSQSAEVAHPVLPQPNPPSAISVFALVPQEPFGLPVAFWIGGFIYLVMLILIIGSLL